ncbi:hypothetical protein [Paraflavitalea sp. CAU 1676]|uniref:hypothetical protein n=1 Tax=Paraflavitalea sp. CAU 1676 TaxID=3032598 RepID=UPI0023DC7A47|nr:hypothetical protein [Paraflavitalea sp. CAU 1676]MDF2191692.1 hypothetical protein [Paraflavitalea sp. CAU 1676]
MSYILFAFIGEQPDLQVIADRYQQAKLVSVGKKIFIIPMTEELYDEMNEFIISEDIGSLTYMSSNIEVKVLAIIGNSCIGYVEAEYCGQGGQTAIIWRDGKRDKLFPFGPGAINSVLKELGVVRDIGLDEFDSINLGRHRSNGGWLASAD